MSLKENTEKTTKPSLPPLQTDESRLITISQLDRKKNKLSGYSSVSVFVDLILGLDTYQRVRVVGVFFTIMIYMLLVVIEQGLAFFGYISEDNALYLTIYECIISALSYVIFRTNFNLKFKDNGLTLYQIIPGMISLIWFYAIGGLVRGAIMCLIVQALIFAIFSVTKPQSRALSLFSFLALAAVMLYQSQNDPLRYPVAIELVHFLFAGIVFVSISILSDRMSKLRNTLKRRKKELENALEKIKILATLDDLTGLLNRRAMTELMTTEKIRQKRRGYPVALVLLDIDFFKKINDTHGHHTGDQVLKLFSQLTKKTLREEDSLSRWGGEEFLLMLPHTSVEEGILCVERIRTKLGKVILSPTDRNLKITFSAGLTLLNQDESIEKSIEKADKAMYKAKNNGRNNTVVET